MIDDAHISAYRSGLKSKKRNDDAHIAISERGDQFFVVRDKRILSVHYTVRTASDALKTLKEEY